MDELSASDIRAAGVTLLGDDLFSRQPMCEAALAEKFNFIFVCLPESHPALYDWIGFNAANGNVKTVTQVQRHGRREEVWQVRYLNDVTLRSEAPALSVNWCELTVLRHLRWQGASISIAGSPTTLLLTHKPLRLLPLVAVAGRPKTKTTMCSRPRATTSNITLDMANSI